MRPAIELPSGLRDLLVERYPGGTIVEATALAPDRTDEGATTKATGYGRPLLVRVSDAAGAPHVLVFRTSTADEYGHDRRADRAAEALLAYDTFGLIPHHIRAIDVGAIGGDGRLVSLRGAGEPYLLTTYAPGRLYADDLRRVQREGEARPADLARVTALAACLAELHAEGGGPPAAYTRAVRDLVGSGEGVFGIIDGYPADTPAAPPERLHWIERRCLDWRWRLRERTTRLCRTHGDFHPFNIVFREGTDLSLLDASRGCRGEAADDVTCLAINYVFFALADRATWVDGFGPMWRLFWRSYLDRTGDRALLSVAAPFLAWRGLVLASPRWYPELPEAARHGLLGWIEAALDAPSFDPDSAEDLFP